MQYQLAPTTQQIGDRQYLAHELQGESADSNRNLLTAQVPNFGVIQFGDFFGGQTKVIQLSQAKILSAIQVVGAFAFAQNSTTEIINFSVLENNSPIAQLNLTSGEMPFSFPPGAILQPNQSIQIRPTAPLIGCLITWQPVNLIHYFNIDR